MDDGIKIGLDRIFDETRRPRTDFREVNPDQFGRADGNMDTVRRLAAIETRAAAIKQRLRAHVARNEKLWIANEAGALLKERAAPPANAPVKISGAEAAKSLTLVAQRNVRARVTRRMTALNTTKARMSNAVIRSSPVQKPKAPEQKERPQLRQAFRKTNRLKV